MAQRWRSRARWDSDLDEDGSPPFRQPRRGGSDEEDDEVGNEDLSLEIIARAQRKRRWASCGGVTGFANLLSVSSGDDEDAVVELAEADEPRRKQKKRQHWKQRKRQRKEATAAAAAAAAVDEEEKEVGTTQEEQIGTAESVLTEDGVDAPTSHSMFLRKLLRIPRYFDPGETLLETCFNCSEEGHVAANCPMGKRKKPCFVCGLFGHNAKQCKQGQDCFICKKGGHMAKDCPDKHKRNDHQSTLCIRCGETGHDMFGCANDYPPDDIEQIRCYACNQKGHLCCSDFFDNSLEQVSCYNCAQSGHSGLGCAKQRREASAVTTPTLCFKCGEEGHFARGCTKNAKSDGPKGWSSPHSQRKGRWKNDGKSPSHIRRKEKWKKDSSARSAPHDACTTSKSNSPSFEERMGASNHKSKWRGGWTGDDDLPSKKYKPNGWGSPATPKRSYTNHQYLSGGGDYFTPQSSRRHNHGTASPGARKHRFSSSIFAASNTHVRFKRS
ncbi:uncharacterized protein [Zea mays]|uniref:Zinc knuckle (CCHC-type) family protein n=3 Tax=Zea mays TaxID=4577 RepID=A0A1D6F6X8_MAIZE|nr:uncharacterized protein LOC100274278 isoform X1 [Zea mays]ONM27002.1 zinc knuckle (CCHC-type) family protein [Zea mays]|eukprot:XP_008667603.1 uncharacterized protein LOC100274278 isoform X1 [Zea mays]